MLVSKSFGTQETLLNGALLRDWLGDDARLYAVSANVRARAVPSASRRSASCRCGTGSAGATRCGRRWASPIALAIGFDGFQQLLAGAAAMDAHVAGGAAASQPRASGTR